MEAIHSSSSRGTRSERRWVGLWGHCQQSALRAATLEGFKTLAQWWVTVDREMGEVEGSGLGRHAGRPRIPLAVCSAHLMEGLRESIIKLLCLVIGRVQVRCCFSWTESLFLNALLPLSVHLLGLSWINQTARCFSLEMRTNLARWPVSPRLWQLTSFSNSSIDTALMNRKKWLKFYRAVLN